MASMVKWERMPDHIQIILNNAFKKCDGVAEWRERRFIFNHEGRGSYYMITFKDLAYGWQRTVEPNGIVCGWRKLRWWREEDESKEEDEWIEAKANLSLRTIIGSHAPPRPASGITCRRPKLEVRSSMVAEETESGLASTSAASTAAPSTAAGGSGDSIGNTSTAAGSTGDSMGNTICNAAGGSGDSIGNTSTASGSTGDSIGNTSEAT